MTTPSMLMVWIVAQTTITPDADAIPGTPQIQQLINGLANLALLACLGGGLLGGAVWAVAAYMTNPVYVAVGKRAVITAALVAAFVGALSALVNFAFDLGSQVDVPGSTTP